MKNVDFQNHCEVVDINNEPLCILSKDEAHRQNLYYRSVVIILKDWQKKLLLRFNKADKLTFSSTCILPVFASAWEAAIALAQNEWNVKKLEMKKIAFYTPSVITCQSFVTIYEVVARQKIIEPIFSDNELLSVDIDEFKALCKRKYQIDSLLIKVLLKDRI